MWGETERSRVLGAPGSNSLGGLIATSTNQVIGEKANKVQGLSQADANDLCERYRPLALKIAGQYRDRGVALDELRSAGLLGLVQASKRFDPERGIAFGGYAKYWIKGQILDLFKPKADAMGLGRAHSLSARAFTKENDDGNTKLDLVTDDSEPNTTADLSSLTDRERGIFTARLEGKTLDEIGNDLAISKERVRQLNDRAVENIRTTKGNIARACIPDLIKRRGYKKPSRPSLPFRVVKYPCRTCTAKEIEAYEPQECIPPPNTLPPLWASRCSSSKNPTNPKVEIKRGDDRFRSLKRFGEISAIARDAEALARALQLEDRANWRIPIPYQSMPTVEIDHHRNEEIRRFNSVLDSFEPRSSQALTHHRFNASRLAASRGDKPIRIARGPYGGPIIHRWGHP